MHKLSRKDSPICLNKYKHGIDDWKKVPYADKSEIWKNLNHMQVVRCAYCEAELLENKHHIEHFRQRDRYPQGTYDWGNIFGSCNREDSCGKHKDKAGHYDYRVLIKPDNEEPDDFFVFVSDGSIQVREGLNFHNKHRAEETLRIFNLNAKHGSLRQRRQQAVLPYLLITKDFEELEKECTSDKEREYVRSEYKKEIVNAQRNTAHLPFATAIRHSLLLV